MHDITLTVVGNVVSDGVLDIDGNIDGISAFHAGVTWPRTSCSR